MKVKYSHHASPAELYDIHDTESVMNDVGMGEFRHESEKLLTVGASTCIVIAAYNDESKRGLLGHFSDLAEQRNGRSNVEYENYLRAVRYVRKLGALADTEVWLGGGSFVPEEEASVEQARFRAQDVIDSELVTRGLDEDGLMVAWSEPLVVIDAELDRQAGLLRIFNYPNEVHHQSAA